MNTSELNAIQSTFEEKGYAVIESGLDESVLDSVLLDLEGYFNGEKSAQGLVPYADNGRIQDAWFISNGVLDIAKAPQILEVLNALYGAEAAPFQTLNFPVGTEQAVHVDSIHFNSEPFGMMCGVWLALEDIGPDQGPLIYYPGSHKLPEMNFEEFGLPANYDYYNQYLDGLQNVIKENDLKPEYGLIKKGQALIWSANLMHGGSPHNNKELTRQSQVTHYFMGKPKCWRPGYSEKGRSYFKPLTLKPNQTFHSSAPQVEGDSESSSEVVSTSLIKRIERSIKFRIKHYILKK